MDTEKLQTLGGLQQFDKNNCGVCLLFVIQSLIITRTDRADYECSVKEADVALHLHNIQLFLQPRHKSMFILERSVGAVSNYAGLVCDILILTSKLSSRFFIHFFVDPRVTHFFCLALIFFGTYEKDVFFLCS